MIETLDYVGLKFHLEKARRASKLVQSTLQLAIMPEKENRGSKRCRSGVLLKRRIVTAAHSYSGVLLYRQVAAAACCYSGALLQRRVATTACCHSGVLLQLHFATTALDLSELG